MNDLKEFAIFYVNEHDRLSKEEKQLFYNFIEEASNDQVTYLLTTGKMKNKLTENDLIIIKEAYGVGGGVGPFAGAFTSLFGTDQVTLIGPSGSGIVAGLVAAALIARGAYKLYKNKINKYGRQCKHLVHGSPERKKCERDAKSKALNDKIQAYKTSISKLCPKSKDPEKCKASIMKKISKETGKLKVLK